MSTAISGSGNVHVTSIKINKDEHFISKNNNAEKPGEPIQNGSATATSTNGTTETVTTTTTTTEVTEVKSSVVASSNEPETANGSLDKSANNTWSMESSPDESRVDPSVTASSEGSSSAAVVTGERGIDDLLPATDIWTTKGENPVKLRISQSGPGSERPVTVPSLIQATVRKIPLNNAMAVKRNDRWVTWTYQDYYNDICKAAKAFIKLGLEPHKSVGIIGFNSPEWFLSDLGAIFAGGFATGIYTTNSPEAVQFVAESCLANVLVVENNVQLDKVLKVRDQLPHLKAIVQYSGDVANRQPFIYSWSEFMALADQVDDKELENRMKMLAPNKCCTLIYTSGTTGNPKGVMLSHDNITWTAGVVMRTTAKQTGIGFGELCQVSYLPLSHIAAQMLDMYGTICFGGTVFFAQPDALKGSLSTTLKEVRPHVFFGVPRVWEKMEEAMKLNSRNASGMRKKIAAWARGIGLKGNYASLKGESGQPFGWGIANALVFNKVRKLTGLDRCAYMLSGAAPITKETLEFFLSLNIRLCEVYGMSECCGPHTIGYPTRNKVTSVGMEMPGMTTKLVNKDEDGNGEIVMHGRHVFMGYLGEEEKTRDTLDEEGGLHSGDIGKQDKDGFYFITGRIKELIITAGGENVAPVPIEESVKEELPVIAQCMLIGDKRKFLSMLLTLRTEVNQDTLEPSDMLTPAAVDWCRSVGSQATKVSEILEPGDKAVLQAIQAGIDRANKKAESRAKNIQKWSILPKDFSIPGGELGPTMKMRRPIITKMYVKTIGALYEEAKSP